MIEKEKIINNAELSNVEKGNLLQKSGYFQDALFFYDQEYIKYSGWEVRSEEFERFAAGTTYVSGDNDDSIVSGNNNDSIDNDELIAIENWRLVGDDGPLRDDDAEEALYQKGVVYEKMGKIEEAIDSYGVLFNSFRFDQFNSNDKCPLGALIIAQKLRLEKKFDEALKTTEDLLWNYKNELVGQDFFEYYLYLYRAILIKVLILEHKKDYKNIVNILISEDLENLKKETMWELTEMSKFCSYENK